MKNKRYCTEKPFVYIASPYTKGDPSINVNFACRIFDQLLTDGKVVPYCPLWSHFQHTIYPRPYNDWINYDHSLLPLFDCCLRLTAKNNNLDYEENRSSGADKEVKVFRKMGKEVFFSINELYAWVEMDE